MRARPELRLELSRLFRVLVGGALAGAIGVPGTAHATAGPRIDSVSLSRGSVSARGFALARVTVTTRVSDWAPDEPAFALLDPAGATLSGGADELVAALHRVSGVPGTGTYRGTVYVPSSARGRWRVARITSVDQAGVAEGVGETIDPRADGLRDVTLTVHGTHPPVLRLSVAGAVVRGFGWVMPYPRTTLAIVATLIDADTGRPLPHWRVWIHPADDLDACMGTYGVPTDRRGRVTEQITEREYGICAGASLPAPAAIGSWAPVYAYVWASVSYGARLHVHVPPTVTTPGARVRVDGNVLGVQLHPHTSSAAGTDIRLQQAVGRRWHTVDRGLVTRSGRYHLHTGPVRGRSVYRVWYPTNGFLAGTVSHSFPITAQRS